ncbi:MAG: class I SAM-dependent methyltransferase [Elusimicrobia bacterium]|nr:class I SAM-dependent methyltransferase [Elusimicrobiota bacterium]
MRIDLLLLVGFSFLSAAYQGLILQELMVGLFGAPQVISLVLAGGSVCFGLGSALARYLPPSNRRWILRWGGLCAGGMIFLSLGTTLALGDPWTLNIPALMSVLLTMGWFGTTYVCLLSPFLKGHRESLGWIVALTLGASLLGFLSAAVLPQGVGVNCGLVLAAIAAMALSARSYSLGVLVLLALCSAMSPTDAYVEKIRSFGFSGLTPDEAKLLATDGARHVFGGWSPMGRLDVYQRKGADDFFGMYNYFRQWSFSTTSDRDWLYSDLREGQKALVVGIGAGNRIPPSLHDSSVLGVELNSSVVDFFQRVRPDINGRLFHKIKVLPYDGRAALDQIDDKFDLISFEMCNTRGTSYLGEDPDYLVTQEAVDRIFALLKPSGTLLAFLSDPARIQALIGALVRRGIKFRLSEISVEKAILSAGTIRLYQVSQWRLAASRQASSLAGIAGGDRISRNGVAGVLKLGHPGSITDDRPYTSLRRFVWSPSRFIGSRSNRHPWADGTWRSVVRSYNLGVGIAILALLAALAISWQARGGRSPAFFFFLIGMGPVLLQLLFLGRFRSLLNNPFHTGIAAHSLFLLFSGLGGVSASWSVRANRNRFLRIGITGLALIAMTVGLFNIPFSDQSLLWRWMSLISTIAPIALVSGVFFPVGLMSCRQEDLGRALLLDGLGAFCGAILFFLTSWGYGISYNLIPVIACYLGAAVMAGSFR